MKYSLESVVAKGGGHYAYIDGYRIGGKTGTAQKVENGHYLVNNYIMSFMSIVPSNDPKAVFYLAIDNPKHTALLSSYTTAPIAKKILLDIIDILEIPRQDGGIEKVKQWDDITYITVPNVIGLSIKEASRVLYPVEVEVSGSGEKVIEQSPKEGERIDINSKVRIFLG
jgi:stage V sporulation protein D (sporulation-specific penicillin-binding protein)